jgi:hypothetical protein
MAENDQARSCLISSKSLDTYSMRPAIEAGLSPRQPEVATLYMRRLLELKHEAYLRLRNVDQAVGGQQRIFITRRVTH